MESKLSQILKHLYRPYSLRYRLIVILLLDVLIPLTIIGSLGYFTLYAIQKNKVESAAQSYLDKIYLEFRNIFDNLDYTSQQLAYSGQVGSTMQNWLITTDMFEKYKLTTNIKNQLSLIGFTNSNLGLILYYIPDGDHKTYFETTSLKPDADFDSLPVFFSKKNVSFAGPHSSLYRFENNKVLSILRLVDIHDVKKVYIYIESNHKVLSRLIVNQYSGMHVNLFLVNAEGRIAYSDNETKYQPGVEITIEGTSVLTDDSNSDLIFRHTSEEGWSLCMAVSRSDFNHEVFIFASRFLFLTALSLGISLTLAMFLWRSIYKPIQRFSNDIEKIANDRSGISHKSYYAKEYDNLVLIFRKMRDRIETLLLDIDEKDRAKRHLEAEKLMYQINPHFLYNALDCIRWQARMHGQESIDGLVSALNRLLHYNLGRQGEVTTVQEEIEAVYNFIKVQRYRCDFIFCAEIQVQPEANSVVMPRFILQPIVENAFLHGLREGGTVTVSVQITPAGLLEVLVTDDENEPQDCAKEPSRRHVGRGIGMQFVKKMMDEYYPDGYSLSMEQSDGRTVVRLTFPINLHAELGEQP